MGTQGGTGTSVAGMGGGGFGGAGYGGSAFGGGAYGGGGYGGGGYGYNGGAYGGGGGGSPFANPTGFTAPNATGAPGASGAPGDLTGTYLGTSPGGGFGGRGPRVIANPTNNTLLIQATAQEYESIQQLIKELDVPPRQVLVEAKIYSIDLSHAFSSDVTAALQALSGGAGTTGAVSTAASLLGTLSGSGVSLSAAALVGKSRELLGTVSLMESESNAKIISAPSVIATDSIPATVNVGTTVPTLQGSITSSIGGAVTNAVSNTSTGITLAITARVTPSGIVTMVINQNVSDPEANTSSGIDSPSFATKSIQTQVTVQDGDTIAIGGMIQESTTSSLAGIPVLDRIPVLGALFGSRSYSKERTELIIFLTPHVILDSNQLLDATDELKDQIKLMRKDIKE
jgi:general secretion pathway protein D